MTIASTSVPSGSSEAASDRAGSSSRALAHAQLSRRELVWFPVVDASATASPRLQLRTQRAYSGRGSRRTEDGRRALKQ